jgi:hypothetical protein
MDVDHLGGCASADPTPSRACASCAALAAIIVPRDRGGHVTWTPGLIAALEHQHVQEGRSYKWLARRFDFTVETFRVVRHRQRTRK